MQALKLLFFKYYPRFVRMVGTAVKPLDFKFGACYHKGIETGARNIEVMKPIVTSKRRMV